MKTMRTIRTADGCVQHRLLTDAEFKAAHHPEQPDNHIRVTLEFIPVAERLPKESGHFYALDGNGICNGGNPVFFRTVDSAWFNKTGERLSPTHWAEIPSLGEIPEIAKEGK